MNDIFIVSLTNSLQLCLIDSDDIIKVTAKQWLIHDDRYVISTCNKFFLHKFVLNTEDMHDHKNRFRWDCRKSNLRPCNKSENAANSKKKVGTVSKYKGVTKNRRYTWKARLKKNYQTIHIGTFKTELEAALAYDKVAKEVFKEFANLNFP